MWKMESIASRGHDRQRTTSDGTIDIVMLLWILLNSMWKREHFNQKASKRKRIQVMWGRMRVGNENKSNIKPQLLSEPVLLCGLSYSIYLLCSFPIIPGASAEYARTKLSLCTEHSQAGPDTYLHIPYYLCHALFRLNSSARIACTAAITLLMLRKKMFIAQWTMSICSIRQTVCWTTQRNRKFFGFSPASTFHHQNNHVLDRKVALNRLKRWAIKLSSLHVNDRTSNNKIFTPVKCVVRRSVSKHKINCRNNQAWLSAHNVKIFTCDTQRQRLQFWLLLGLIVKQLESISLQQFYSLWLPLPHHLFHISGRVFCLDRSLLPSAISAESIKIN